jgi:hypothetical protein
MHGDTPLNTDFGINNEREDCGIGRVGGVLMGGGESEQRRLRWGNMVDGLHIPIQNRTKKKRNKNKGSYNT